MDRICPKCHSRVEGNAKFCDECGASLESANEAEEKITTEKINLYKTDTSNTDVNFENKEVEQIKEKGETLEKKQEDIKPSKGRKVLGVFSFLFGIASILTVGAFIVPEFLAVILGSLSQGKNAKKTTFGKIGFVLGIIGFILLVIVFIAGYTS